MTQTTKSEEGQAQAKESNLKVASEILSLEQHLEQSGPFHWKSCMTLFHDVCVDLERIHEQTGVLGNITIRSLEIVKGSTTRDTTIRFRANPAESADSTGKRFSFPDAAYFSPEKCLKKELDARSDVYALGCVIYECLTGSPPFVNRNEEILKEMHVSDAPLPPGRRTQQIHVPDEVDELVLKALNPDPAKRQQSAGELRGELGMAVQQEVEDVPKGLQRISTPHRIDSARTMFIVAVVALVASVGLLALEQYILSTDHYKAMVEKTQRKAKHHYLMNVEYGTDYLKQMEFDRAGKPEKPPLEITQIGGDVVLFATTKRSNLKDAVAEAHRRGLMLWKADLHNVDLSNMELSGIRLQNALLEGSNFSGTNLSKAILIESSNVKANFENANLSEIVAMRSNFSEVNFTGAKLTHAHCLGANFDGAISRNANLDYARPFGSQPR